MSVRLPSRYEDLDNAFRGRLRPDPALLDLVKRAFLGMKVSGGIRFLPLYGKSGSGKSCAAGELATHLPQCSVFNLPREAIESGAKLVDILNSEFQKLGPNKLLVAVIDQYEEAVAERTAIPTQFVERLSLLDRGEFRQRPLLVIWLTTSRQFQAALGDATSRNERILVRRDFELAGPPKSDWPSIIADTFQFHNRGQNLADLGILQEDLERISNASSTLGSAMAEVGLELAAHVEGLQDLSEYKVVMLWPVTDGQRIARVAQFTDPRQGYRLDWAAWYRELSREDQTQLPLPAYNRARLYFDMRLVPIAAADLHSLCKNLDADPAELPKSSLSRFSKTHFFNIVSGIWNPDNYSPLRERVSKRANDARIWYETATNQPTKIGRRLALCLRKLKLEATHEKDITSPHGSVRADVLIRRPGASKEQVIVELKAYSADNTMPSSIRDAVRSTLRKHAILGGFLPRQ